MKIEVWNKNLINDRIIGMGIIDINPMISFDENAMLGSRVISVANQSMMES